ncbi:MAG: pyruvate kinase alpha/beta domain-containing protein [Desulfarculaceae bacterium]|jgi:hypothetical protein
MTQFIEVTCKYFNSPGPKNTAELLALALQRSLELGLKKVLVATSTGRTVEELLKVMKPGTLEVVAVSYVVGFKQPGQRALPVEAQESLESKGVRVLTAAHALSGVGKGVASALGGTHPGEIVAQSLRMLSQGVKVGVEIALMAADAGLVTPDEEVLTITGTGRGADTALIVKPANSHKVFDLKVLEVLAKPRQG